MKRVFYLTKDISKFQDIKRFLAGKVELLQSDITVTRMFLKSEKEIAMAQAIAAMRRLNSPLLVDVSGLYLKRFKSFPGPFTEEIFERVGTENIHDFLNSHADAEYKAVLVYYEPASSPKVFEVSIEGKIKTNEIKTVNPEYFFYPNSQDISLAELDQHEKFQTHPLFKALKVFSETNL